MNRTLALLLALALAASGAAFSAAAGDRSDRRTDSSFETRPRVVSLTLTDGTSFRPRTIIFVPRGAAGDPAAIRAQGFEIPTPWPVDVQSENRLDIGSIPAIGSVLNQITGQRTATSQFRNAARAGDAFRLGDALVVEMEPRFAPSDFRSRLRVTTIANQSISFIVRGTMRPLEAGVLLAPVSGLTRIGEARSNGSDLLIVVPPSLVRPSPG